MTPEEVVNRLSTLAGLAAGLLSVSVTLVALIPTLLQLARERSPTFFSQLEREGALTRVMMALTITVMGFGSSLLFALIGLFHIWCVWLWLSLAAFVISLLVLVVMSVRVAFTTRDVM